MKRILCMFAGIMILLTGCAQKPAPPVTDGFSCTVVCTYGDETYTGRLTREGDSKTTLTLSEPAAVSGLSMAWTGEEVLLSYGGLELKVDETALPVGAAVKVLCRTLDECAARAATGEIASRTAGELAGVPFTMTFDDATGQPLELALPSVALTVSFSSFETLL